MNDHDQQPGFWIRGSFYPRKSTTLLPPPEVKPQGSNFGGWTILFLWIFMTASIYMLRRMDREQAQQIQSIQHRIEILESQPK